MGKRTLVVEIVGDSRSLDRAMSRSQRSVSGFEKSASSSFKRFAGVAKIGALGVAAGLGASIKSAGDFEQQMSKLGSVASANGKQMDQFRKQALKAGLDTKYSASQAAAAQIELAKGGLSVANIMKGGLKSALSLAAAGDLELADAAAFTANAMNLFALKGKDAGMVADALAVAANKTTADVADFGMALTQGGGAAKAAGLSFNQTVVALEALALAGVKNSDAGTSMKAAFVQLAAPTEKQINLTKKLGLSFFDQQGKMRPLAQISAQLQKALGGVGNQQRLANLKTLAGTDGFRTLLALYDQGPRKLEALGKATAEHGYAAKVAARQQDNFKGALEQFKGTIETVAIVVGSAMLPALTDVTRAASKFIGEMLSGEGAGGRFRDTMVDIGASIANVAASFRPVLAVVATLGIALGGLTLKFASTKAGIVTLHAIAGALAARLAALGVAFVAVKVGAFAATLGGALRTGLLVVGSLLVQLRTGAITAAEGFAILRGSMTASGIGAIAVVIGTIAGALLGMKSATDQGTSSQERFKDALQKTRDALNLYSGATDRVKDADLASKGAALNLQNAIANRKSVFADDTSTALQRKQAQHDVALAEREVARATREATTAVREGREDRSKAIADLKSELPVLAQKAQRQHNTVELIKAQIAKETAAGASADKLAKLHRILAEASRGLAKTTQSVTDRINGMKEAGVPARTRLAVLRRTLDDLADAGLGSSHAAKRLREEIAKLKSKKVTLSVKDEASAFLANIIRDLDKIQSLVPIDVLAGKPAKDKRRGGLAFGGGGLVPVMASAGEMMVTPGGGASIVPGVRRAADNVSLAVPGGTAFLTDDGQARMMQGASMNQALATQAPHFRKGGWVKTGFTVDRGSHPKQTYSGGMSFAELLVAGDNAGMHPNLSEILGVRKVSKFGMGNAFYGEKPEGRVLVRAGAGKKAYNIVKSDVGSGQRGDKRFTIDLHGAIADKIGKGGKGFLEVAKVGTAPGSGGSAATRMFTPAALTNPLTGNLTSPLVDDALGGGIAAGREGTGTLGLLTSVLEGIVPESSDYGTYKTTPGTSRSTAAPGKGRLSGIKDLVGRTLKKFPRLHVSSTTGGNHVSGSDHYAGLAADLSDGTGGSGYMDKAGAWVNANYGSRLKQGIHNPTLSINRGAKVGAGFWGKHWATHRNHLHLAHSGKNHYRAGGVVGRFGPGGVAEDLGGWGTHLGYFRKRFWKQGRAKAARKKKKPASLGRLVDLLGGSPGNAGADRLTRRLNQRLRGRSEKALLKTDRRIVAKLKKLQSKKSPGGRKLTGAERIKAKRLRGARSLVQHRLGVPIGQALGASDRTQEEISREDSLIDDQLILRGIDPNSEQGVKEKRALAESQRQRLVNQRTLVGAALERAKRAKDPKAVAEVAAEARELDDQILHLTAGMKALDTSIADLAAAEAEARKAATEAMKALTEELKKQNEYANAVQSTSLAAAFKALADVMSGQLGPIVGVQSQSAGSADVAARY